MEEETKKLLEQNIEISRESLKILKGIKRSSRILATFKILYWLVILGVLAGTYYFIEPYIKAVISVFQDAQQTVGTSNGGTKASNQTISPNILKNLPPNLFEQLQNFFKTK